MFLLRWVRFKKLSFSAPTLLPGSGSGNSGSGNSGSGNSGTASESTDGEGSGEGSKPIPTGEPTAEQAQGPAVMQILPWLLVVILFILLLVAIRRRRASKPAER